MPCYDYKCPECGHTREITSSVYEVTGLRLFCPYDNTEMRRLFSAPGLVFKGTGWAGKSSPPPTTREKSVNKWLDKPNDPSIVEVLLSYTDYRRAHGSGSD